MSVQYTPRRNCPIDRELLAALKAQHDVVDLLMAMLLIEKPDFRPSESVVWPIIKQAQATIAKAEGAQL